MKTTIALVSLKKDNIDIEIRIPTKSKYVGGILIDVLINIPAFLTNETRLMSIYFLEEETRETISHENKI